MIIESALDASSSDYKKNYNHMSSLVEDWRTKVSVVKKGGGEESLKKQKSRGKYFIF